MSCCLFFVFDKIMSFFLFNRHWLFDEIRRPGDENDTRPNVGNDVPFGAGGFHWQ